MEKRVIAVIRIIHIVQLFGLLGGLKYVWYYNRIMKKGGGYDTDSGKQISLRYAHEKLVVRADSTDLLLVESILVGKFRNRKWIGEYNQIEDYIKRLSIKDPIIVDAGANIGLFSRLMLGRYPKAKIFAIEPEFHNFQILCDNIEKYAVEINRKGIWSHDCKLEVVPGDIGAWGFMVRERNQEEGDLIDAISIDSLIQNNNLDRIDLLKIDIEGSEYEIFNSDNLDWLELCNAIVVETHEHLVKGSDNLVNKILAERGFDKFVYEENQLFIKMRKERAL